MLSKTELNQKRDILQANCHDDIKAAIRAGKKRIIVKSSVGTGKTRIAGNIIKGCLEKGNRSTFLAPYTTLINQTVDRFAGIGIPTPGVFQGNHELTDPGNPVQIGTPQTLARRDRPYADIVIVDESHYQFRSVLDWMESDPDKIFIGLSATPWSKGMGKYWDELIVVKSLRETIAEGLNCDYSVYGIDSVDMDKVKTVGDDYSEKETEKIINDPILVGNIVETYLDRGDGGQFICFPQTVLHANNIANQYQNAGIKVEVITSKTPMSARSEMFKSYEDRVTKGLISVGCLIAGFDSYVEVLQCACRTKDPKKFIQMIGRGLRPEGGLKVFDHSGTFTDINLGYPEDVDEHFTALGLCNGDKKERKKQREERMGKLSVPRKCPKCKSLKKPGESTCRECGFTARHGEDVTTDETKKLKLLDKRGKSKKEVFTKEQKQQFYSELIGYKELKKLDGKFYPETWVGCKYRSKFGVWPSKLKHESLHPSKTTIGWVTHQNIKYAKSMAKKDRENKSKESAV